MDFFSIPTTTYTSYILSVVVERYYRPHTW